MKQGSFRTATRAGGFTLIEMMVVFFIIGILLAILIPGMREARDQAKGLLCKTNLYSIGEGVHLYAEENRDYFCSGSVDPEVSNGRDGPIDEVGWIADLINHRLVEPDNLICPTNVATHNQKLLDHGGEDDYSVKEALDLIARGYDSNYTQSWYMARTQWDPSRARRSRSAYNLKRLDTTVGPLHRTRMALVPAASIPLLGDGRSDPDEVFRDERCVKTLTDGPYEGTYGLQNYADFGPAHGFASRIFAKGHERIRANVLFADGHVDVFQDNDRDGEFGIDITVYPYEQRDIDPTKVFDGVIGLGRRSRDVWKSR